MAILATASRQNGGLAVQARRIWLESVYERFHHPRHLGSDPICLVHRYDDPLEREIVGLIASSLAYGNVKSILRGVASVLDRMEGDPRGWLADRSPKQIADAARGWRYRVTSGDDLAGLLIGVKRQIERHSTLHESFAVHWRAAECDLIAALGCWVDDLCASAHRPLRHLLPHPARGSACKRLMLYLRWMVRRDAIDPGGWDSIPPAALIVPLDTHVHALSRRLRLTRRRQANLKTALEVTAALRRICPDDPLRYDFAMTRPGILRVAPPPW